MELSFVVGVDVDGEVLVAVNFFHGASKRSHDRRYLCNRADHREAGGETGALKMTGHLVAHDSGLFEHFLRKWLGAARGGLVDHYRERRLQCMGKITDMRARALYDFFIGLDQGVGFARERRNLFGEFSGQALGAAERIAASPSVIRFNGARPKRT